MILEHDARKLRFYLHFGAGMLVWFVHLPLVAMVGLQIDLMWRYKIISGKEADNCLSSYLKHFRLSYPSLARIFIGGRCFRLCDRNSVDVANEV